jgi:predicted nucleic acid-binding protein
MIFIDTSAFLALVKVDDTNHPAAKQQWQNLLQDEQSLYTNNYVVVESIAIIQNRVGLNAVKYLHEQLLPLVKVFLIDEIQHFQAMEAVFEANCRQLSLVDCSAFATMRREGIETVFTFDGHFGEQGFKVIP